MRQSFGAMNFAFPGIMERVPYSVPNTLLPKYLAGTLNPVAEAHDEEAILLSTVVAHELRHYYDYHLWPSLAILALNTLRAHIYGFRSLYALLGTMPANGKVPIPFTAWCRMDHAERMSRASSDQSLYPEAWDLSPLPSVRTGEGPLHTVVTEHTEGTLLAEYARCKSTTRSFLETTASIPDLELSISNREVLELAALISQGQYSWSCYDPETFARFSKAVVRRGMSGALWYGLLNGLLSELECPNPLQSANAIIAWSLSGYPRSADDEWFPCDRFRRLIEKLVHGGSTRGNPITLKLCAELTSNPTVEDTLAIGLSRLDSYAQLRALAEIYELPEETLSAIDAFIAIRRSLMKTFLNDPDAYLNEGFIADHETYGCPTRILSFERPFLVRDRTLSSGVEIRTAQETEAGEQYIHQLSVPTICRTIPHMSSAAATQFFDYDLLISTVFDDAELDGVSLSLVRQVSRNFGVRLEQII